MRLRSRGETRTFHRRLMAYIISPRGYVYCSGGGGGGGGRNRIGPPRALRSVVRSRILVRFFIEYYFHFFFSSFPIVSSARHNGERVEVGVRRSVRHTYANRDSCGGVVAGVSRFSRFENSQVLVKVLHELRS